MNENESNSEAAGTVTLDLRQELASREPWEPLVKIVWTASQMSPGQSLKVIAPFEPVLLTQVLAAQGFAAHSTHKATHEWEVVFEKQATAEGAEEATSTGASTAPQSLELDFRGVPQAPPLAKIIEALLQLPGKPELIVHTDARPVAEALPDHCRCVVMRSDLQPDGSFKTRIQIAEEPGNR